MKNYILAALEQLQNHNQMLADYWISVLLDEHGEPIPAQINQANLRLIEADVMHQILS
jgi:hypothetical protein